MPQKRKLEYYSQRDLAAALEVETWAIRYAIQSRNIQPAIVTGSRRIFNEAALHKIKVALSEIAWRHRRSNRAAAVSV